MAIVSINPAINEVLQEFEPLTNRQLELKLDVADKAFHTHRKTSFAERSRLMTKAAEILQNETDRFARLMTMEMGKPLDSARAEALKCASACRYYAENAEQFLADEEVPTSATRSFIRYPVWVGQ